MALKKPPLSGLAWHSQRRSDEIKDVLLSTGLPKKQQVGAGEWEREWGSKGEGEGGLRPK